MYTNHSNQHNFSYPYSYSVPRNHGEEERFFWAPFVMGGLAGTALGYGIANNDQIHNQNYYPMYYPATPIYYPYPTMPTYSSTNYYY